MKPMIYAIVFFSSLIAGGGEVHAQTLDTATREYSFSSKLGRGLLNFVSSPLEIPRNINNVSATKGNLKGWTLGLGTGVLMTFVRAGAGIIDTVTFPFEFPNQNRAPLLQPVYPWQGWDETEKVGRSSLTQS